MQSAVVSSIVRNIFLDTWYLSNKYSLMQCSTFESLPRRRRWQYRAQLGGSSGESCRKRKCSKENLLMSPPLNHAVELGYSLFHTEGEKGRKEGSSCGGIPSILLHCETTRRAVCFNIIYNKHSSMIWQRNITEHYILICLQTFTFITTLSLHGTK